MTPRRLIEQAKYFGITVPQAIEVGQAAKEFMREKLSAAVHGIHAYVRCDGPEQTRTFLRIC